jgi:hypothetical protein
MPTLQNLSPELIKAYQDEISKSSSPATAKRKEVSLNKFFDWAKVEGHLDENPIAPQRAAREITSNAVVVKPKKVRTVEPKTWVVVGMTACLVVLVFLLTWKVGLPIPFIRTPASEGSPDSLIQTNNQNGTNSVGSSLTADGSVNGAWKLYAKLKLTEADGSPKVGAQSIAFKVFNQSTGGESLFTSGEQTVTTDSNGTTLISLDNVPASLFFENEKLFLEPTASGTPTSSRIPVNSANVSANLGGYLAANPEIGAGPETVPIINSEGALVFASESPAIKAPAGDLLIEGQTVTVKTADGGDGDLEFNPDGKGIAHFLFEGANGDFLNAQGPNLRTGSLYYGMVPNNATGYKLINLQSGAPTMTTKFSVDALGNTYIGKDLNVKEDIATNGVDRLTSTGALTNITGYNQISGNFVINQGAGDFASITKDITSGGALSDVLTLTLDERGKPETSNSTYSTLVLNRYDGAIEAMALLVDNGNAQFDGQLRLGRFDSNPTAVGTGSLIYNSTDNQIYFWDGSAWVSPSGTTSFADLTSGTNTTATMVVGSGASLTYSGTGTINATTLNGFADTQFLRSDTSDNYTSGTLTMDLGTTLDIDGDLIVSDTNIVLDGASTTFTVTGDMTLDIGGDQLILADGDTINIGGLTGVTYNSLANAGDSPEEAAISSDNDLYIGGDLEVDGTIYGNVSGAAGSVAWDDITSPTDNLTLTMGAFNSIFNWDPGADTAETNFSLTTQGEDTLGTDEDQVLFSLSQTSNGVDVTQAADSLLALANNDANDPVVNGIRFDAGAAGTDFTYGINFDAADIGTAEIVLENGEQIHNQTDGTITLEDGSGSDYLSTSSTITTVSGDLAVNGTGSADITSTTGTATLFNAGVTTLDIGSAITTLNLGDAATTKTIDLGGVTSSGTDTINISTNATLADTINIGNTNAATVLNLSGGTINLLTDSTGNGEVVLPDDAVGPDEVFTTGQTDEYCLTFEATGGTWEWQQCSTGVTMPWSSLLDPITDLTLNHSNFNTLFNWDPGADSAETAFSMTFAGEDTLGSDENQVLFALSQADNGADVTEAADSLLTLTNNDANDPVNSGIRFDAGAAGTDFTYGINFDLADIGTAEIVLENAEQIHNQTDGTITLEDGSGIDYASFTNALTTLAGALSIQGASLTTTQTSFDLLNTTATTINFGGGATTTMNVGPTGANGTIAFSGGSADTGCTLNGVTGDLTCSGNISGTGSSQGFWQLNNQVLSPTNSLYDVAVGGTATTSASFQAFGIENAGGNVVKLNSDTITTGNVFEATASAITSGNMISLNQMGDADFTGNGLYMNFDDAGNGAFTGNFLQFDNNGSTVFRVDSDGNVFGGDLNGSNLILSDTGTLQVGGATGTAYNSLANVGESPVGAAAIAAITSDNDLFVGGDMQVAGTLYDGSGNPIAAYWTQTGDNLYPTNINSLVGIGTTTPFARLTVVNDPDTNGGTFTGKAAFAVDQYENEDILTASASGQTRLTLENDGTLRLFNSSSSITNDSGDITIDAASNNISFAGDNLTNIGNASMSTLTVTGGSVDLSGAATNVAIIDNTANAFTIRQGANTYMDISTTDNTESLTIDLPTGGATSLTGNLFTSNIAKTINMGTGTAADTINIGTSGADIITIGNSNASTTLALTGGDDWSIATNGNFTTGGYVAATGVGQFGAQATAAYSRFGSAATGHSLNTAADVLISEDLELNGGLYLDGKTIYNTQGTAAIILCTGGSGASCENTSALQNTLSTGSWVIDNSVNVGEPALAVNNAKGGDLIVASASGVLKFRVANSGDVFLGDNAGTDLTVGGGTGKIDAGTVDPPYTINGKKFATYMAGMVGVKEEVVGLANTSEYVPGHGYRYVIDFNSLPEGSDLWLFGKTTNIKETISEMVALLTPSFPTRVWYEVDEEEKRLVIYSAKPTKISYRLTAPRFDAEEWSNRRDEESETIGFVINDEDRPNGNPVSVALQAISDFTFEKVQKGFFRMKDGTGNIVDGIESMGTLVAGNIKVGALQTIDQVTETLTAKNISAQEASIGLISPLAGDENVIIRLGSESSESGKLAIQNAEGEEVASIDAFGNANFQGDVRARNLDEMEKILDEVKINQKLLSEAGSWGINTASGSANLTDLSVENLFVTGQGAFHSLSVSDSLAIGTDMVIQSIEKDGERLSSIDTLSAPLRLQALALAPIEMMAGMVKIDTSGNVNISGNLNVAGRIESKGLTLTAGENPEASASALLSLNSEDGTKVASVDASGSAEFASLRTGGLVIAAGETTPVSTSEGYEIQTNTSIGSAIIPAGASEITVKSPQINANAMVYVTPTSSTNNRVLYVKMKDNGYFKVGFTEALEKDSTFNWWVVKTE